MDPLSQYDPELRQSLEHIIQCWGERLSEDDNPHEKLKLYHPHHVQRTKIVMGLLQILTLDAIHELPLDIIRLLSAADDMGLCSVEVTKALLLAGLMPEAQMMITAIIERTALPSNVIPFDRRRLH